jgi:3-oxoacyl-[acyl-carrier-protein] synthase II
MTATATRVVITGADIICPLGSSWTSVERALIGGCSGVAPITAFDASPFPVRIAAQVRDWVPPTAITRVHGMALHTATRAAQQAGLRPEDQRTAVCMGVGKVPIRLESVAAPVDAGWELARDYDFPVKAIARALDCRGPIVSVSSACATGNDAIGLATQMLRRGDADAVLAGAADAPIAPLSMVEYLALGALAQPRNGECHPRPFDRGRNGFVLGEGAAMFVLETLDGARRRGAAPLAEIIGYGASSDAYSLVRSHPQSDGAVNAMRAALADAQLDPACVDCINAHGTGTLANDMLETLAIKRMFGAAALTIPVSSTKSMTGHLLAASAAVECAFAMMMLHGRFVPPTINLDAPDRPDCDLDYVPSQARSLDVKTIMSNAFGFGGQNSVLVLAKVA